MIIENAQAELNSNYNSVSKHSKTLMVQQQYNLEGDNSNNKDLKEAYSLDVGYLHQNVTASSQTSRAIFSADDMLTPEDKIKKMIIEALLGKLFDGDKAKKVVPMYPYSQNSDKSNNGNMVKQQHDIPDNPYNDGQKAAPKANLNAMIFDSKEEYYQKQSIDFSANISFNTPNGDSYNLSLDLSFSKELYQSSSVKLTMGDVQALDPLVVNYGENVNPFDNLSSTKFAFDLDNNGETDMIPYLKQGAGYLALDKNGNGNIDNGSELFGPQTNDGFADLSLYDEDGNHFIDENDSVFDKLKVWSFDKDGNSSLVSLIDANVGAIYLGDVQSGYNYQNSIDDTEATQKSNGVFIKEDGSALGVINSIDITA